MEGLNESFQPKKYEPSAQCGIGSMFEGVGGKKNEDRRKEAGERKKS